jgi:1-acyl-sn-glycerol-3-phosphate acyltransferase
MNGPRLIIKHLLKGDAVILFPEGSRSPDGHLQAGQPGAGLIACKAGVPILPMRIFGAYEALPRGVARFRRHPLRIVIGPPFHLPPAEKGNKEAYHQAAAIIMSKIAALP